MPGEFADRRMFEQQVGRELQAEPILKFDDQEHRVGGIEPQPSERHLRVDRLVRQVERARQILHTPVSDRGFARIFGPQYKLPSAIPCGRRLP